MKAFKGLYSKVIILMLTLILLSISIEGFAATNENKLEPRSLSIDVEDRIIGEFYYDNFSVDVQRINSGAGPGYCLDLDKDYPSGQRFSYYGKATKGINNILAHGYPNVSAEELGVNNDDEAYLATQVAIWALFEGYDINEIGTNSEAVNKAVINIYNNVISNKSYALENDTVIYKANDYSIQGVVIYIKQPIDIKPTPPEENLPTSDQESIVDEVIKEDENIKQDEVLGKGR